MDDLNHRSLFFQRPQRERGHIWIAFWLDGGHDLSIKSLVEILVEHRGFRLIRKLFDPCGACLYFMESACYSITLIDDEICSFSVDDSDEFAILDFTSLMRELLDRVELRSE